MSCQESISLTDVVAAFVRYRITEQIQSRCLTADDASQALLAVNSFHQPGLYDERLLEFMRAIPRYGADSMDLIDNMYLATMMSYMTENLDDDDVDMSSCQPQTSSDGSDVTRKFRDIIEDIFDDKEVTWIRVYAVLFFAEELSKRMIEICRPDRIVDILRTATSGLLGASIHAWVTLQGGWNSLLGEKALKGVSDRLWRLPNPEKVAIPRPRFKKNYTAQEHPYYNLDADFDPYSPKSKTSHSQPTARKPNRGIVIQTSHKPPISQTEYAQHSSQIPYPSQSPFPQTSHKPPISQTEYAQHSSQIPYPSQSPFYQTEFSPHSPSYPPYCSPTEYPTYSSPPPPPPIPLTPNTSPISQTSYSPPPSAPPSPPPPPPSSPSPSSPPPPPCFNSQSPYLPTLQDTEVPPPIPQTSYQRSIYQTPYPVPTPKMPGPQAPYSGPTPKMPGPQAPYPVPTPKMPGPQAPYPVPTPKMPGPQAPYPVPTPKMPGPQAPYTASQYSGFDPNWPFPLAPPPPPPKEPQYPSDALYRTGAPSQSQYPYAHFQPTDPRTPLTSPCQTPSPTAITPWDQSTYTDHKVSREPELPGGPCEPSSEDQLPVNITTVSLLIFMVYQNISFLIDDPDHLDQVRNDLRPLDSEPLHTNADLKTKVAEAFDSVGSDCFSADYVDAFLAEEISMNQMTKDMGSICRRRRFRQSLRIILTNQRLSWGKIVAMMMMTIDLAVTNSTGNADNSSMIDVVGWALEFFEELGVEDWIQNFGGTWSTVMDENERLQIEVEAPTDDEYSYAFEAEETMGSKRLLKHPERSFIKKSGGSPSAKRPKCD